MTQPHEVASALEQLKRDVRRVIRLAIALYVAVAVLFVVATIGYFDQKNSDHKADRIARNNQQVSCAFRNDLRAKIVQTKRFLDGIPKDQETIEFFGYRFSRAQIVFNLKSQQETLRTFRALDCPQR